MESAAARTGLSKEARDFSWTVNAFVEHTAGVTDAITVSADGLPLAASRTRDAADADRLAAIVSGIASLAGAASQVEALGPLNKVIMDLAEGYLLVSAVGHGALIGVRATKSADLGTIAYEMAVFANRAGAQLSPPLIHELRNSPRW